MKIKKFNQLYENQNIIKKGKLKDILGYDSNEVVMLSEIEYNIIEKIKTIYETKLFCLILYKNLVYITDSDKSVKDIADRDIGDDKQQANSIYNIMINMKNSMDKFSKFMLDFLEIRKVYKNIIGLNINNLDNIPEIRKYNIGKKSKKFNL